MSEATQSGQATEPKPLGEDILTKFAFNQAKVKGEQLAPRPEFADCDPEDIAQELLMYLIQKADQFDPSRSGLNTFINRVLDSGVRELLRAKKRQKRHPLDADIEIQSFEATVDTCDETFANLGDEVSREDLNRRTRGGYIDQYSEVDERDAIEVAMSRLTPEMRRIVLFMADHSLTETRREFGLTRPQFNKHRAMLQKHFRKFDAGFFWE